MYVVCHWCRAMWGGMDGLLPACLCTRGREGFKSSNCMMEDGRRGGGEEAAYVHTREGKGLKALGRMMEEGRRRLLLFVLASASGASIRDSYGKQCSLYFTTYVLVWVGINVGS